MFAGSFVKNLFRDMSSDSNFRKFFIDGGNPGSSLSEIKWIQHNCIKFCNCVSSWSLNTALVTISLSGTIWLKYQKPDSSKVKSDSMASQKRGKFRKIENKKETKQVIFVYLRHQKLVIPCTDQFPLVFFLFYCVQHLISK